MEYPYRYTPEQYEEIVAKFLDESDWLIDIDLTIFLEFLFRSMKEKKLGKYFLDSCLAALQCVDILQEDQEYYDDFYSFINESRTQTFIFKSSELENFKKTIIRQHSPRSRRDMLSHELRKKIFERDNFECRYCRADYDLVIDHIYPFVLGGSNNEENLQTLCRSCNSAKGSKVVKP